MMTLALAPVVASMSYEYRSYTISTAGCTIEGASEVPTGRIDSVDSGEEVARTLVGGGAGTDADWAGAGMGETCGKVGPESELVSSHDA